MVYELFLTILNYFGIALLIGGGIFELIGALGVLRMPDFFTRAHAVTITVVGGTVLPLIGISIISLVEFGPEGIYLASICIVSAIIMLITAPTGSHMLVRAALRAKVKSRVSERDRAS
ncbi:MAG: monovalent cation/H(+) antiporter subunit G [Desulfurococcaceae archaeon]